jgi:hypothetical protein
MPKKSFINYPDTNAILNAFKLLQAICYSQKLLWMSFMKYIQSAQDPYPRYHLHRIKSNPAYAPQDGMNAYYPLTNTEGRESYDR